MKDNDNAQAGNTGQKSALDELFRLSAKYSSSAEFKKLLEFINKFPNLSPFNAFLVHMQDSLASVVLTPTKWLEYGRQVKPLSRPFIILIPFGPVDFVYNITDTEPVNDITEELPTQLANPFKTTGVFKRCFYTQTCMNAAKEGIKYGEHLMQKGAAGYATKIDQNSFKVNVNSSLYINEKYSTLVHELAHIYCGHLGSFTNSWWDSRTSLTKDAREIEAESVSYFVCTRYGLKTTAMEYLLSYIKKSEALPNISVETILTVANHIEKIAQKDFKPKKKNIKQTAK